MCRYTKETASSKLPYALVGQKFADKLTDSALKKHSVFHGIFVEKGKDSIDEHCISGDFGMHIQCFTLKFYHNKI